MEVTVCMNENDFISLGLYINPSSLVINFQSLFDLAIWKQIIYSYYKTMMDKTTDFSINGFLINLSAVIIDCSS